MSAKDRQSKIQALVEEQGYRSVSELSKYFQVSDMTIRRDLERLDTEGVLQRTYGGARSYKSGREQVIRSKKYSQKERSEDLLVDKFDVIIASSLEKRFSDLLLRRASKKGIPIIAESLSLDNQSTIVAVDNLKAGYELGRWAGIEASKRWNKRVQILDLTYHLSNTRDRSEGFLIGVREICPTASLSLSLEISIDAESDIEISYQLTRDALSTHKEINVIFAINDAAASGAMRACRELSIDPQDITVFTFGLEGDSMRNAVEEGTYCKAGLAMFPEIVGPICIEAAISAKSGINLPEKLITPFAILTTENIKDFYDHSIDGWVPLWSKIIEHFTIPLDIYISEKRSTAVTPCRIGFIVPFRTHEWYQTLVESMQEYASDCRVELEIVDIEKYMRSEIEISRRAIASLASMQVKPNDVIIVDGGPIAEYLAIELLGKSSLTVITNATTVFEILKQEPQITLISTGGALRRSSQLLVGPTAERALHELRANTLFLCVTGISLDFGLSHTNISEVTIKQAMIQSAHDVILIADYTNFNQESIAQVAKLDCLNKIITDGSLPNDFRIEFAKRGINVMLTND